MHVSMAVRDANGKPISAREAVYFTAHYDDNGKLTEVSSPTPVHFAGDGPDAIGYIEVDGKVFTLPVTKGKYQEMMREVAKNNGLEVEISQSVGQSQTRENTLALENGPQRETLAIEDAPNKLKDKRLAIEDAPNKSKDKTEAQVLAEKMRESREARGNPSAEPESRGSGKPVNVKSPKVVEQESEVGLSEAQVLAEKMRESREARGNPSAEPESRGGGKPVNVKSPKVVERESEPELNEAQKMAKKMQKSRADRDNVVAETESRGGGKAVNVNSTKDDLLKTTEKLTESISDLARSVKEAAQKGSKINAMTGKKVSSAVKRLSSHTRSNIDPVIATGSKAKGVGKARTVQTPNIGQKQSTGHSR